MTHSLILRLPAIVCAFAAGCATARLYEGDPLPESQVSQLSLLRPEPNLNFSSTRIDGHPVDAAAYGFATAFEILPGAHTISFSFRIDAGGYCDAREHLCPSAVVSGSCSGPFTTRAGERYAVVLHSNNGTIAASIRPARGLGGVVVGYAEGQEPLSCDQALGYDEVETSNTSQF